MMRVKRQLLFAYMFVLAIVGSLLFAGLTQAQWAALPPYNILWPLWSPPLSPVNPTTGLPTPIITEFSKNTILPVQPAIIWDPVLNAKGPVWLAYNVPPAFGGGITFFEDIYGFKPWPPPYLVDPATGAPLPITLPIGYSTLLPTKLTHFATTIDTANLTYAFLYGLTPAEFLTLLTPAQLWGIPYI
ncbi:MAG: hypothetical protein K6U11_01930 [bacterium]|nr:hypothetical protein [bacterium]